MRYTMLLSTLAAFTFGPAIAGPVEDYEAVREAVWQDRLDHGPMLATSVGDRRGDGMLGDLSVAEYDRAIRQSRDFLARLQAIDTSDFSPAQMVDYAVLRRGLEDEVAAADHAHTRLILFNTYSGWFASFASLPDSSTFFTPADFESYVTRLENYRAYNAQGIERSREAVRRGLTQACEPMQGFEAKIARQIVDEHSQSPFWKPFAGTRPGSVSEQEWTDLQARARAALTGSVFPAYRELFDFYTQEYAPKCRTGTPGILATEGGADYYTYAVASYTTTDMTPDEVHRLGLSEVARIRADMEAVAADAGFDTREAFVDHLRTDPEYYMTDADEYVAHVAALAKTIDGFMPKLFGKLPHNPYTVLPIPVANAAGNTTAYYEPGSLETGAAGVYRINTTQLDQRPLWELPALGMHEAVPGHHHQIALQQELEMHPLRANGAFFTAFVEGWGLYSERLGIEMGLYDTPAKQMGRLSYEMWRATRLVVDTGIHSKGWSKQQAVDYMLDNTALSSANIDAEVNRYITWPGQALAYKVGELKIREMRARAEAALGADFDLRAFHDTVLENGAVPLDVLEAHVDRWIAAQRIAG